MQGRLEGGFSLGQMLNRKRGKAPSGSRWTSSSVYVPAGQFCNVRPTKVKNPKVAAQMQQMHEVWYAKKFGERHEANQV